MHRHPIELSAVPAPSARGAGISLAIDPGPAVAALKFSSVGRGRGDCRSAWRRPRLANHRATARALKFEGSPLMGIKLSDGDKFLDASAYGDPGDRNLASVIRPNIAIAFATFHRVQRGTQTKLRRTCALTENGPDEGAPEGQVSFTPLAILSARERGVDRRQVRQRVDRRQVRQATPLSD
jgi:hypothetical protein